VWLVTDRDGKNLVVFVAAEEAGDAVIDENCIQEAGPKEKPKQVRPSGESPNGKWFAFLKDYNLYVRKIETGEGITLSSDGVLRTADSRLSYFLSVI